MTTGILVCGHGSRSQAATAEFAALVERLRDRFPGTPVEHGYLEFANPVLRDGLDRLRARGCDHVLAVPGMLFAAMHAKNDIPSVLNAYGARHSVRIEYGRELGVDPKMIAAAADRIQSAMDEADRTMGPVAREDTCLAVIGRGASDPDANANVAKTARMLQEGAGFGWLEVGYSGVTFPLVEPCLRHAARLGYRRILVFPYFLFTGVLIDRIHGFAREVARDFPDVQFRTAGYLNCHPLVVETFAERLREIGEGQNAMNCRLCKYRTQILGFESEVGLPQESHHHHVEGQGAHAPGSRVEDCQDCDDFCTGACRLRLADRMAEASVPAGIGAAGGLPGSPAGHGHAAAHARAPHSHDGHLHHHHPYPHSRHPHGPESVRPRMRETTPSELNPSRAAAAPALDCETDPARIYERSFAEVARAADILGLPEGLRPAAVRMVHACGMPDIVEDLVYSEGAPASARRALADGATLLCDCETVRTGIQKRLHARFDIRCHVQDSRVRALAEGWRTTRSAAAVELWRESIAGAFVVIGNAPTALFHLLARLEEGWPRPGFVLAVPVGFVGAEESKRRLATGLHGVPFLALRGRRGGSAIAAAAVNALAGDAAPAS